MKKLKCILLIDDDPTSTFISSTLIQSLNITESLASVGNGREALDFIQKHCLSDTNSKHNYPQLILLDINMPVMNGFEFLEAFVQLALDPKPFVVMLTSSFNPKDKAKAATYNVSEFLAKPLSEVSLKNVVEKALA